MAQWIITERDKNRKKTQCGNVYCWLW